MQVTNTDYKVLGQEAPVAATLTDLYVVPNGKSAVVSTLTACNTGTSAATVRVAVRVAGAAITAKQYVVYGVVLNPSETVTLTVGITLAATDVVSVYTDVATVSFNLFGVENT